ncbi:Inh inhibitor of prohead protease gp21 [Acinetobacter phage Acj61]|uniref:Inh inhibitor of prohead protease gp21 n=1 Tax=Acinetobacter phage Acj61 TaxID=760732 RepID=E5E4G8_9CAUD|nr:minor head protein inhibitor of protease [Acinetobacter phage Acj61]ADG36152.1 Inh inhibitor of prohead protease gp21 [Acinetobacter phage Acj61]
MLDKAYIDEIKTLGVKESKEKLAEYAAQFNISVKKTRSFDNMVADIKDELAKLANEPMPEQPSEGLTITDLIQASDEISGKSVFEGEAKESALAALRGEIVEEKPVETAPTEQVEVVEQKEEIKQDEPEVQEVVEQPAFQLPPNFSPTIQMLGRAHTAYVTLPWWIYDWITKNPQWKTDPNSFHDFHGVKTLLSLIYYIQRDGFVRIRETRNSSFVVLE